jgi:biotin transporter BioY
MFLGEATWGPTGGFGIAFIVFLIGDIQQILIYRRRLLSFANVYYYLCLLVNSLGVLGVGCKSGRAGVSEGAALLQPLSRHTLLYHY